MLSDGEDGKGPERGKKLIRTGKSRRGSSRSRISTNARKMTPGSHWTNSQGSLTAETDDVKESPGCRARGAEPGVQSPGCSAA